VLRWRLIIGTALIAALAGLCWLDVRAARPGVYLVSLAFFVAWFAAGEMLRIFAALGSYPSRGAVFTAALLPVAVSGVPVFWPDIAVNFAIGCLGWLAIGLALGLIVAFAGEMNRYESPGKSTACVALTSLAALYVGGCLGTLVQLRVLSSVNMSSWRALIPLVSLIATVKLSDTCQYFIGRAWGSHKLAPRLSPGKTWEGAIGGVLLATTAASVAIAAYLQGWAGLRPGYLPIVWFFTLSVAVAGILGDLAESLLKRDAGVKDSSDWLPGFGGVLDMLDSILFAAPIAYVWWAVGPLGP